jgi:hypothetical protein
MVGYYDDLDVNLGKRLEESPPKFARPSFNWRSTLAVQHRLQFAVARARPTESALRARDLQPRRIRDYVCEGREELVILRRHLEVGGEVLALL